MSDARPWACSFMLSDLAGRYTAEEMKQVADALDEAARDAGLWDDSEQGE